MMHKFYRSILALVAVFFVITAASGCKVFKKSCDCPKFTEERKFEEEQYKHASYNEDMALVR